MYRDFARSTKLPEKYPYQSAAHNGNTSAGQHSSNILSNTPQSGSGTSALSQRNVQACGASSQLPGTPTVSTAQQTITASTYKRRFFELCVNTGKYAIMLGELNVSEVQTDQDLFAKIVERYRALRPPRIQRMFMTPIDVHFVFVS